MRRKGKILLTGRKKIAITVVTILLLVTLIPIFSSTNTVAQPLVLPNDSNTVQATLKQPTIDNLVSQQIAVSLSAIENSTDNVATSTFNETFFDLPDLSGIPGLLSAFVRIQAHVLEQGINATAPHTSYIFGPFAATFFGPFSFGSLNQTTGLMMIMIQGSNIDLCNQTLNQISEAVIQEASSIGLELRKASTQILVVPLMTPSMPPDFVTAGFGILTSLNDSLTAYNYLESLLPDGTLAKNIAQKASNEKYISINQQLEIITSPPPSPEEPPAPPQYIWITQAQAGMVLENQIGKNGDTYSYSLRTLLEPSGNISIEGISNVYILLPVNSVVTNTYNLWTGGIGPQPMLNYYSVNLNVDDMYVTYTLESGVPNLVIEYDMSNWNMNPGESGKLYLTIKNTGTSTAYGVSGSIFCYPSDIISFTEAPWGYIPINLDNITPGESVKLEYNVTAFSVGIANFQTSLDYYNNPAELINHYAFSSFEYYVGIPGPHLLYSVDYSNYVLKPGDVVSAIITIRNVGTQTATNVSLVNSAIPPLIGPVVDSNVTLPDFGNYLWPFGDIPAGSSSAVNVTMRYDITSTSSAHTGAYMYFGYQISSNEVVSQGIDQSPLLMPGVRTPDCFYVEFEKTPSLVSVNPGDEILVSVKVKNLGLADQIVYIMDLYPEDVFEPVSGSNMTVVNLGSGSSVTMTYRLRAKTSATLNLPPPFIGANYATIIYGEHLLGTPLEKTTHNTAYVFEDFLVDAIEEAGIEVSGNTPAPTTLNVWGDSQPPGAEPPAGVNPLSYIRVESNETFTAILVFHYNEEDFSEGVTEENLAVFLWDEENQVWVELPSIVDTELNTVTVEVSGSSYFMLGAKIVVEQVFQGFAILRIDGKWYMGDGKLYLSEDSIRVEVEGQSASWSIYKHLEKKFIELYFGKGELGNINLIIHQRGETQSALAVGRDVFFCGSN